MPEPMGFFTDTTICIGCKACEVACKNWNQLPAREGGVSEMSGASRVSGLSGILKRPGSPTVLRRPAPGARG